MPRVAILISLSLFFASLSHGGERFISEPDVAPPIGYARSVAMATDGENFVAVWNAQAASSGIFAQRVDRACESCVPIVLAVEEDFTSEVDIAWNGHSYVAVWSNQIELRAIELDRDAKPIAGTLRTIAFNLFEPKIAATRNGLLVVARTGFVHDMSLVALTLDSAGTVANRIPFRFGSTLPLEFRLFAKEDGYFLALDEWGGNAFMRFRADGSLLDVTPRIIDAAPNTHGFRRTVAAPAGSGWRVAWITADSSSPDIAGHRVELYSSTVDADGVLAAPRSIKSYDASSAVLDLARRGDTHIIAIADFRSEGNGGPGVADISALTIDSSGELLEERQLYPATAAVRDLELAVTETGYGVSWIRGTSDSAMNSANAVAWQGPGLGTIAPTRLSNSVAEQRSPSLATNGAEFLAVWLERSGEASRVRARMVSRSGVPFGDIQLLGEYDHLYVDFPRVIFAHGIYLVWWMNGNEVVVRRMTSGGVLLDREPLRATLSQYRAEITATSTGFLAFVTQQDKIHALAISASGDIGSLVPILATPPPAEGNTQVEAPLLAASSRTTVLLLYSLKTYPPCSMPGCGYTVRSSFARLDHNGRLLGLTPLLPSDNAISRIVSDGENFAIGGGYPGFTVRIMSGATGEPLSTTETIAFSSIASDLIWTGIRYAAISVEGTRGGPVIRTKLLTREGKVESSSTHAAFGESLPISIRAAAADGGNLTILYERIVREHPFNFARRVAVRTLDQERRRTVRR